MLTRTILAGQLMLVGACSLAVREPQASSPTASCGQLYRQRSLEPMIAPLVGATALEIDAADRHNARIEVSVIALAAERYCLQRGRYPTSVSELIRIGGTQPSGASCVIRFAPPEDPWGHPYRYEVENGVPHIMSIGKDGTARTADDLSLLPSDPGSVQIDVAQICKG